MNHPCSQSASDFCSSLLGTDLRDVDVEVADSGQAFVFRGRQGHLIKVLWWDGQGLCLIAKRLEKGRFVWPATAGAAAALTPPQPTMPAVRQAILNHHSRSPLRR